MDLAKRRKIFVTVFVEGDDRESQEATRVWDDDAVCKISAENNCVALKIDAKSRPGVLFREIYKVMVVPSIFFIDPKTSLEMEVIMGQVTVGQLLEKFHKALEHTDDYETYMTCATCRAKTRKDNIGQVQLVAPSEGVKELRKQSHLKGLEKKKHLEKLNEQERLKDLREERRLICEPYLDRLLVLEENLGSIEKLPSAPEKLDEKKLLLELFHNDLRLVELDLKALENAKQDEWKEISSDRIEINPLAAAVSDLENLKMLADESSVVFQAEDMVHETVVLLSDRNDEEFEGWKRIKEKREWIKTCYKLKSEKFHRWQKAEDEYDKSLMEMENRKRVLQKTLDEVNSDIVNAEGKLEKSKHCVSDLISALVLLKDADMHHDVCLQELPIDTATEVATSGQAVMAEPRGNAKLSFEEMFEEAEISYIMGQKNSIQKLKHRVQKFYDAKLQLKIEEIEKNQTAELRELRTKEENDALRAKLMILEEKMAQKASALDTADAKIKSLMAQKADELKERLEHSKTINKALDMAEAFIKSKK